MKAIFLSLLGMLLGSMHALGAGKVYLVMGSDTALWNYPSNAPTTVDAYQMSSYYRPDLLTATNNTGYKVMDPAWRSRFIDSYGQTLKLTWWMMAGNVFRYAANRNVPIPNTMTLHLMKQHHGDAIRQFGDELSLHYHTFYWSDYNNDGVFHWNQSRTFQECREDFDATVSQFLIEENVFPVSFRSGWHWMDNDWQAYLNTLLPYSMHNDYGVNKASSPFWEPMAGAENWSTAPATFIPYHPSTTKYQTPGDGRGWEVRSIKMQNVTSNTIHGIFAAAAAGTDQVACIWGHLPEDFVNQVVKVDGYIHRVNTNFPAVLFRYCTAVEAMQRWQGTTDDVPPNLEVVESTQGETVTLTFQTSEPIWQPQPFVSLKDIFQQCRILSCTNIGSNTWQVTLPVPRSQVAKVGIAVTDLVGNLATRVISFLPDDLYIDNRDSQYSELQGSWVTSTNFIWGSDARAAKLGSNDVAQSQWLLPITRSGRYSLSLLAPALTNAAGQLTFNIISCGVIATESFFASPMPSNQWVVVATPFLDASVSNTLQMVVSGTNQAGSFVVADALRVLFIPNAATVERGAATVANQPLNISTNALLGNDFGLALDPLIISVGSSSAQGGFASVLDGSVVYVPPPNFTGLDSLTCSISDGRSGTNRVEVQVMVVNGPLPSLNQLAFIPAQNGFVLRFSGVAGAKYTIHRSLDLQSWTSLDSVRIPIYGVVDYAAPSAPPVQAFYRLSAP